MIDKISNLFMNTFKNYLWSLSFFSKGPVPMCLPHVPPFANAINSDSFSGVLNLVYNDTSYKTPVWQGFTRCWDLRGVSFCHLNLSSLWAGTVSIALAGDFCVFVCVCIFSVTLTFPFFEQVLYIGCRSTDDLLSALSLTDLNSHSGRPLPS